MLNLRQLEYFYYVSKYGGFTQAARRLPFSIQQPALSVKVKALEENLGVKLYQVIGRRFRLTPAGEQLYGAIVPFFESLDGLERHLKGEERGRLIIAEAAPMLILKDRRDVFSLFRARHPGVQLSILERPWATLLNGVLEGEVDIAFGSAPELRGGISFEEWTETDYLLLCPAGHPLSGSSAPALSDIAAHPLVLLDRGTADRHHIESRFAEHRLSPRVALETSSYNLINDAVEDGLGLAIVNALWPRPPSAAPLATSNVSHLFGKKQIGLFRLTSRYVPPYVRSFLSILREAGE